MRTPWVCAPWGTAVEWATVWQTVVVEMEGEISTSSWGLFCGIVPCLQMGASSSFSTWTWRSFWLKMEWAACITTTVPVQLRSPHRAPSQLFPARAPSAYHPHPHLALHLHHLLPPLHHHSLVWRLLSHRALEEAAIVSMVSSFTWTTLFWSKYVDVWSRQGTNSKDRSFIQVCVSAQNTNIWRTVQQTLQSCQAERDKLFLDMRIVDPTI